MNWKVNLHQNLKILCFDYKLLSSKDIENLFETPNDNALISIILFLMSKIDKEKHNEFARLSLLNKDSNYRREYSKKLHVWSMDIISKTFMDFNCPSSFFTNPYGNKIYEILAKLSTSVMKQLVWDNEDSDLLTVRQPFTVAQLKELKISPTIVMDILKRDFVNETQQYSNNLKHLQMRKELMQSKIETRKSQIFSKTEQLNEKEKIFTELISEMKDILGTENEFTNKFECVDKAESAVEESANRVNTQITKLMSKVTMFNGLCEDVKTLSEKKNSLLKVSQPTVDGHEIKFPQTFYSDKGRLQVNKLIEHIAMELSLGDSYNNNNNNLSSSNELPIVFNSLASHLSTAKEKLAECKSASERITLLRNDVIISDPIDSSKLNEFGPVPSIASLLRNCKDSDESLNHDTSFLGTDNQETSSDFNYSDEDYDKLTNNCTFNCSIFTASPNASLRNVTFQDNDFDPFDKDIDNTDPNKQNIPNTQMSLDSSEDASSDTNFFDKDDDSFLEQINNSASVDDL